MTPCCCRKVNSTAPPIEQLAVLGEEGDEEEIIGDLGSHCLDVFARAADLQVPKCERAIHIPASALR